MIYKLDGVKIAHVLPLMGDRVLALKGLFDLPKRKRDTERNWSTSIEPYTDASDMNFDGRALELRLVMPDYKSHLDSLKEVCIGAGSLEVEGMDVFPVVLKEGITVEETGDGYAFLTIRFWQGEVVFEPLTLSATGGGMFEMDGYNLEKDFGLYVSERKNYLNEGKRLEVSTTAPYIETVYRERPEITLSCTMYGADEAALYHKMKQFHALCASPGLRTLKMPGGKTVSLYVKDGISASIPHPMTLKFELKARIA